MIIPVRTSIIPRRTPYANYLLIILNFAIFLLTFHPHTKIVGYVQQQRVVQDWAQIFILNSDNLRVWQFISYAFLHASWPHIVGNMYFLYIFGNNVNDRLGNVGYICFYLAGGIAAGIGHTLFSNNPVLGASGAVAAVTGGFFVLYPKAIVTMMYWLFFFIGTFEVPVIWLIVLKSIILDNIITPKLGTAGNVAYDAHLAGYAFGIASLLIMLWAKLLRNDHSTLLSTVKQWSRRRKFRDAVNDGGYNPFNGLHAKSGVSKEKVDQKDSQKSEKIIELRQEINSQFNIPDIAGATQGYLKLMAIDEEQVLPKQHQLDVANHLMSIGNWSKSAKAYEKFKLHYPKYEHIEQIKLMLGILYTRYLDKPELAIENLEEALNGLSDESQIEMCRQELAKNTRA